jgi:hypothetical protein
LRIEVHAIPRLDGDAKDVDLAYDRRGGLESQ